MRFDKTTANIINAILMALSGALLTASASGIIAGKGGLLAVICVQSASQAFQWLMTAQGFDRLPNGERLPLDAKQLPTGIGLQSPVQKKMEPE